MTINQASSQKAKIVLVDDHPVILLALSMIIAAQPDMEITGKVNDGSELKALLHETVPDLVILDLSMPDSDGLKVIRDIQRIDQKIKILVYSSKEERVFAPEVASLGANGFLAKHHAQQAILVTIRSILLGNNVFPAVNAYEPVPSRNFRMLKDLSERETNVLINLVKGKKNIEISRTLFISEKTVATHKCNIMKKLNVHNIVELIDYANMCGIGIK